MLHLEFDAHIYSYLNICRLVAKKRLRRQRGGGNTYPPPRSIKVRIGARSLRVNCMFYKAYLPYFSMYVYFSTNILEFLSEKEQFSIYIL